MKKPLTILITVFLSSCGGNNFTVSKIIDGNTFELTNGITVSLNNVGDSQDNIKILERYLRGKILLYDPNNEEIGDFPSDHVTAMVYNSDGDCINSL